MDFEYSQKVKDLQEKVTNFMNENVYENEDAVSYTHLTLPTTPYV